MILLVRLVVGDAVAAFLLPVRISQSESAVL